MEQLTFGEQVKVILSRRGMTIKELAERMEEYTGKPMSRQNLTQRLGRDNFQEQDMRLIAELLGCKFTLSIMEPLAEEARSDAVSTHIMAAEHAGKEQTIEQTTERDITVGEMVDMIERAASVEEEPIEAEPAEEKLAEAEAAPQVSQSEEKSGGFAGFMGLRKGRVKTKENPAEAHPQEKQQGDINPYTGKEYASNSVRMHPKRIGYVQVYDQAEHKWTDMTEWAFLAFQERKKVLLGKDYEPPIYLD